MLYFKFNKTVGKCLYLMDVYVYWLTSISLFSYVSGNQVAHGQSRLLNSTVIIFYILSPPQKNVPLFT